MGKNKSVRACLPLNVMVAQHAIRFLKLLSPSTRAILHTRECAEGHRSTFTLPLDFDPFVFITSSQRRRGGSRGTDQKARPSNGPRD